MFTPPQMFTQYLLLSIVCLAVPTVALGEVVEFEIDAEISFSPIPMFPAGSYPSAGRFSVDSEDISATGVSVVRPLDFRFALSGEIWDETLDPGLNVRFTDGVDPQIDYAGTNANRFTLDLVPPNPGATLFVSDGQSEALGSYTVVPLPEPFGAVAIFPALSGLVAFARSRIRIP